jgi:hypothetical protein
MLSHGMLLRSYESHGLVEILLRNPAHFEACEDRILIHPI